MRFDLNQFTKSKKGILTLTTFASLALFTICFIAFIFVQFVFNPGGSSTPSGDGSTPSGNGQSGGAVTYTTIAVESNQVYTHGSLLVVNTQIPIQTYPTDLVDLYKERPNPAPYMLLDAKQLLKRDAFDALNAMMNAYYGETGLNNVTVTSSYRTEAQQAALTSSAVKAGYSDHHLALSVALKQNNAELANGHWIYENGYKYGFIQRYPEGKEDSTLDTQRYFNCMRYVGIPHATYMHENNLSLEEYVALLKNYTYDGTHLTVAVGEESYEIYYIAANTGAELTTLYIPEGAEYTYSGNNTDGFIVTFKVG